MSVTKRYTSDRVRRIVDNIISEVDDPNDIIDLAILLTLLSYTIMYKLDNVESSDEFIAEWTLVIRQNIQRLESD